MGGDPLRKNETIVALATSPGRGALAVIRLSGPSAFQIAARHVRRWPTVPRVATHSPLFQGDEELDDAVVTAYPAPNSFTGEDLVELSTHGGYAAPAAVISALIGSGATPALPGEFTRRALMNGKLDVLQAEGIGELVNARSAAMRRAALLQVHGGLTRKLAALRDEILHVEALIAYDIDFPGEDDGPLPEGEIARGLADIECSLNGLLSTVSFGRVIREGALVVIAGPPNAGKSSLFNAMLGTQRAIVTEIPGTTRDALEAVIDIGDWPLRLVDTAGLRETSDTIERLGIEVSESYLASADVVLACADSAGALAATSGALSSLTEAPIIPVLTKADLGEGLARDAGDGVLSVSATELTGFEGLFARIAALLELAYGRHSGDELVVTTARQHASIKRALEEIRRFDEARIDDTIPTSVAAVHLRAATDALEELIGVVDVEDVLTKLFSTFCIGK